MRVFENLADIPEDARGSVLAIGNFDGVHRGHAVLLARARDIAREAGAPLAVLTFEPHPRCLFRPDDPPFRLTPPDLKRGALAAQGVDILISLPFDWAFASRSAENFVEEILLGVLAPRHIVVGEDFRFGQLRKGSVETLRAAGLGVSGIGPVADEAGAVISSSRVRDALRHGDLAATKKMLGRDWEIRGSVVRGDQRGRELGYPTANFPLGDIVHPAYGIYAARVRVEGEEAWRDAAVNIGIRPMFAVEQARVESYIFDFKSDIYGNMLRVRPIQFLRGEAKFPTMEALVSQMDEDCRQAREILDGLKAV
ncbi:MAG: bifunctional riboflavin kinase/FAD synthetase [Alphaproteobacteria bacterium]|nr:bifunctional riboflavin kinase/FAD synthetase [Alphaproteobacteria bacterium]